MPQWLATMTAASTRAVTSSGVINFSHRADTLCQKGVHTLFPVGPRTNPITQDTVVSGRRATVERQQGNQPEAGHSPPLAFN